MNIIISNDKSTRLTQYSSQSTYNLAEINFYVAKGLEIEDLYLNLMPPSTTTRYSFLLSQVQEEKNYFVYRVEYTTNVKLTGRAFTFEIMLNEEPLIIKDPITIQTISFTSPVLLMSMRTPSSIELGMTDAQEPIEVNDQRQIIVSNNQNILVAEDNISQCITFKIKKLQDGVNLLTKDLYIDFVIRNSENKEVLYNDLLDQLTVKEQDEYFTITWVVPYAVTKKAGTVKFAISAVGATEESYYIWQTQPASLTILPNLFKRNETIVEAPDELSVLNQLQQDVDAIKESDIYNLDDDPTDGELVFSGGGAPV